MIYIDLLVIKNSFINYLVILSTGIILNRITKFKKVFLSSVIGCIPLVFLFLIDNNIIINIINLLFSIFMAVIAFNYNDILYTVKNILYMYFVSTFIAGSLYLLNINCFANNQLSNFIILILISPIITFIYLKNTKNIKNINSNYYKIDIYLNNLPKISLNSYLDTGNKLIDPYTKRPIILISKKKMSYTPANYVLVPYNTIDNHGLLSCFYANKIYIEGIGYKNKVLIALIDDIKIESADCILNPKLLERI